VMPVIPEFVGPPFRAASEHLQPPLGSHDAYLAPITAN